jgi:hypothetical protein
MSESAIQRFDDDQTGVAFRMELRKWDIIFDAYFKATETLLVGCNERLNSIERRVLTLEEKKLLS